MAAYRWMWGTIHKNIQHYWWDLIQGTRNIIVFWPAVWRFRAWDFVGLLGLIEVSTDQMIKVHHGTYNGVHKRLKITNALCKRLMDGDYLTKAGYDRCTWKSLTPYQQHGIVNHSRYMAEQDARYFAKMLRFVQHWWD